MRCIIDTNAVKGVNRWIIQWMIGLKVMKTVINIFASHINKCKITMSVGKTFSLKGFY